MFQALSRFCRGVGSSTEPSGGSKAEGPDAHNNAASLENLELLTTQASLDDWRKGTEARQPPEQQEDSSEASDGQDDGDALPADDSIRGLTRTRSWVEKHSSLRKKRRLKQLGPDNRAATPAKVPAPENGIVSQAGELLFVNGSTQSEPVQVTGSHAGNAIAPTAELIGRGVGDTPRPAHEGFTPVNGRAVIRSEQGDDPWKAWEAYYRSLSPTGEPPERQRMLVQKPKKPKTKPIKRQKDKQLWDAFEKALQGQLTQAIHQ